MAASVLVVVLGDLGHSPRMSQHIRELLRHDYEVDCIAYHESELLESIKTSPRFHLHPLPIFMSAQAYRGPIRILWSIIKVILQFLILLWVCFVRIHQRPVFILNQNPPSLPLLMILPLVCWIYKSTWIMDWHNFGYSIMQMSSPNSLWMISIAKYLEQHLSHFAHYHMTVTEKMRQYLISNMRFNPNNVIVCYDFPMETFKRSSIKDAHNLFIKLDPDFEKAAKSYYEPSPKTTLRTAEAGSDSTTLFTKSGLGDSIASIKYRDDRPALLVSSTSWTVDEDFGILLETIDKIEDSLISRNTIRNFPQVVIIITGKGPLKDHFLKEYEKKHWKKFTIICKWLSLEDYPVLLGSADLGLCFHSSSSGLDFPMKVVDMLGCSLPVLALRFPCVNEIISENANGYTFASSNDLAKLLVKLLSGFPNNQVLESLKVTVKAKPVYKGTWQNYWSSTLLPLLKRGKKGMR